MTSETGLFSAKNRATQQSLKKLPLKLVLLSLLIIMASLYYVHEARALPSASFTYSPIDPLVNQTVLFTVNGTVSPGTIYRWNFGNGTLLTTNMTEAHGRYSSAGIYNVSLTVSNQKSTDTLSRGVPVFTSVPLTASFSVTPPEPLAQTSVSFDATSSNDPNGTMVGYVWNYGDGSKNSTTNPVTFHRYASVGSYNATLTIIDSNGSNSSSPVPVPVNVLAKVTVTVSASPVQGTAPFTVSFSALASGGQGAYTFAWTFGDGEVGIGQSVSHNYTTAGNYQVQVVVSDSAAPSPHLAFGSTMITVARGVILNAGPIPLSLLLNGIGIAVVGTVVLLLVYGVSVRKARRGQKKGPGLDPYNKSRSFRFRARHGYDLDMMQNMEGVILR